MKPTGVLDPQIEALVSERIRPGECQVFSLIRELCRPFVSALPADQCRSITSHEPKD
jgi:hypothetical protein